MKQAYMLSPEELAALESILDRARAAHQPTPGAEVAVGDVVQLRPGTDRTWECSLMLVTQIVNGEVRGQILRPHRSGAREAWARYSPGEVVLVGRTHYPEPQADIKRWTFEPPCGFCLRKPPLLAGLDGKCHSTTRDATAMCLDLEKAFHKGLLNEAIAEAFSEGSTTPKVGKRKRKRARKTA